MCKVWSARRKGPNPSKPDFAYALSGALVQEQIDMIEEVAVGTIAGFRSGTLRYVEVDGLPIALANVGGAIYAFGDSCRHEGGPLSAGVLIDDTVTCPWHGWTYSIRTGKSIVPPIGLRIPVYPVRLDGDTIIVSIDWPSDNGG